MCISCQLSGWHKTKKHSGRFLVPFYWCFSTNSSVCSILLSFFFYSNLTNDRVANPFSLHLETPSISKMHKHWRVWVVNSTSTVSLSDPVERSAFLMILLFAFIEEGLHFAGFLFLRIFFFISAVFFRVTSSGYLLNYQVDNDLFVYMKINASLMWQVMLSSSSLNSSQCTENSS